ncbi:MAG: sulfatase [Gemmatimonadetes bacterium]|nr:sulfatase [Gemmatimonadota bacterium]
MADGALLTAPAATPSAVPAAREHRARESRWHLAVDVALLVFLFTTMVQGQLYLRYVAPTAEAERSTAAFLAALPFLQWQTLVAALVLGAVVFAAARRRAWALAAWLLVTLVLVLVTFDQLTFKRFHDHLSIAQTDGGLLDLGVAIPRLLGSAASDADWMTYVNFAMLAPLLGALWRRLVRREDVPPRRALRATPWLVALGAYAALAVPVVRNVRERHELDRFPLSAILWTPPDAVAVPTVPLPAGPELYRLRDETWRPDPASDSATLARANALRGTRRRNVVFIVLESVGAHQLLPTGRPDPVRTPVFARLAEDALIFPDVYGIYPATTRAHVPIMTGGRAITWGSVGDELTLPLRAPTLVGALRDAGYRTGLFAAPDLRFGYVREFYLTMPWDTVVHHRDGTPTFDPAQEVHSWGVNEDAVRAPALQWLAQGANSGKPFFLTVHTIATHHPYGTWGGHRGPARGEDDASRYANALHYTDAAIGRLLDDLRARGLLDETLVVVTGDHGEAFADLHEDNWVHRNRLYDENMRNFLFVAAPGLGGGPVVSHRLGQHGDVMPTLLSLLGLPAADVPGLDLTTAGFEPRIVYFHKDARPAQFGLRDGRWKYIAQLDGRLPELYDMSRDPTEQHNVAARHLDRVRTYRELAANWYVSANYEYSRRLVGFDTTRRRIVTIANYARPEPPELRVGHFTRGEGGGFVETPVMAPNAPVYVWSRWNFLPDDITVRIRLVSPRRAVYEYDFHVSADWEIGWYHPGIDDAKEEGVWEVSIWTQGDRLATERFEVRRSAVPALRDAR